MADIESPHPKECVLVKTHVSDTSHRRAYVIRRYAILDPVLLLDLFGPSQNPTKYASVRK
jgi:hypothetical protein